jgi:hypothetical protein
VLRLDVASLELESALDETMTDKHNVYFTRDGELVHLQTNPHFCAEGEEPLDIKIDEDGEFRGLSHETIWHAGAGLIEIMSNEKGQILIISEYQDDTIYSFHSHEDNCIWFSFWDDFPSRMFPFVKDYETSEHNSHIGPDHEEYVIVNNRNAIRVGRFNKRPINQIFDFELGVWVSDPHRVFCLLNSEVDSDDPWDLPGWGDLNDLKSMTKEEVEVFIAQEQKERHFKITNFSVSKPLPLPLPLDTYVAGTFAYQAKDVQDRLAAGDRLKLRLEPTNRHDPWAIEVYTTDDIKLGYVPHAINKPYVELMDEGYEMLTQIIAVEPGQDGDIDIRLNLSVHVPKG